MAKELYIKKCKGKGRGVFCRQTLQEGDLIESCPVIVLEGNDYEAATSSRLSDYFFYFNKEEKKLALVLGFGSLYNHTTFSNAAYELDHENRMMHYYALETIPAGREICINYGGEKGRNYKEWFEARDIEPQQ